MEKKWIIGEMAKLFDVSADALRYYEREGLLAASRQQENNYRRYSYDDLLVLMDILFYRRMEVPVRDHNPTMALCPPRASLPGKNEPKPFLPRAGASLAVSQRCPCKPP